MRTIKIIGGFLLAASAAFALIVLYAGTSLILENDSGQTIYNIEIKYDRGSNFSINSLPNKEIKQKFLGKIGEASTFDVRWSETPDTTRQAQFSVYFLDLSIRNIIRIKILPDGGAVLYEGERLIKPNEKIQLTHNHSLVFEA